MTPPARQAGHVDQPGQDERMHVVATAGHVDHGKSALVRALTGTDPDRFVEEQQRGLTIDLGFAWMTLPGAGPVVFVDVPGHIRFIPNMLAGVAVVEAGLLCVDAREGWRAQTQEHLQILDLIGLPTGLVAVTKAGLVDATRIVEIQAEVRRRTTATVLASAPIVACDSIVGTGLDELRDRLCDILTTVRPAHDDRHRPRLWVDRSFTIAGAGTVITGGVGHGSFVTGDRVVAVGMGGTANARIRGIQALGRRVDHAPAASRAALNLVGVGRQTIRRGDAIVRDGDWHYTSAVEASLRVLPSVGHDVTHRGAYLLYIGTGEHAAQLRVIGQAGLAPGETGTVRLAIGRALPLVPGDRFILRETGRGELIGGGELLDVAPRLHRRRRRSPLPSTVPSVHPQPLAAAPDMADAPAAAGSDAVGTAQDPGATAEPEATGSDRPLVDDDEWVRVGELERRLGVPVQPVVGDWVVTPVTLRAARDRLIERIERTRPIGIDIARLDEHDRAVVSQLEQDGQVDVAAGYAVAPLWRDELASHPLVRRLEQNLFSPPTPATGDLRPELLRALVRRGLVIVKDGVYFAASARTAAATVLADLSRHQPAGITVSEARQALGTTRRWAVPLLELLDEAGLTVRHGDRRDVRPPSPADRPGAADRSTPAGSPSRPRRPGA